jgi:outer membrane protein assembly factor BamB
MSTIKNTILAFATLAATSATAANADWPQLGFNAQGHRENTRETTLTRKTVTGLHVAWSAPLATNLPAMVSNGLVYVASGGSLTALDEQTGATAWTAPLGQTIWAPPSVADGMVFVPANNRMFALDAETGQVRWSMLASTATIESSATVQGQTVYFGNDNGNVYAVNAKTGVVRWTYVDPQARGTMSAPAVGGGRVFFPGSNGTLSAFDANTGALQWSGQIDANYYTGPAAYDHGTVYAVTRRNLWAYDATTGARNWQAGLGEADSAIAISKGHIHMATTDQILWNFDAATGALDKADWVQMSMQSTPAIANGVLYVGSMNSTITAYDTRSDALLWQATTAGPVFAAPTVANGKLYVADGHTVTAYGLN